MQAHRAKHATHHAVTMQLPCSYYVVTMQFPCSYHAVAMQLPVTMQLIKAVCTHEKHCKRSKGLRHARWQGAFHNLFNRSVRAIVSILSMLKTVTSSDVCTALTAVNSHITSQIQTSTHLRAHTHTHPYTHTSIMVIFLAAHCNIFHTSRFLSRTLCLLLY